MRNPHGNLICPANGVPSFISNSDGRSSGPWGVTCGYWRCNDGVCRLQNGEPDKYKMEARSEYQIKETV